jgi:hypothetical protein
MTLSATPQALQSSLVTPVRSHGDSSQNPYNLLPRAPPRRRELDTTSDDKFRTFDKTRPISERLFLDLDRRNDRFRPILPAPTTTTDVHKIHRHDRRKITSVINSSASSEAPLLCVTWIKMRSNQHHPPARKAQ